MYRLILALLFLGWSNSADAGLYSIDEPVPFNMNENGTVQPLPYNVFKLRLANLSTAIDPKTPLNDVEGKPTVRGQLLNRLRELETKPRSPEETLAYAVELIRNNQADKAVNLLRPATRERTPDFATLMVLAHAHTARGEWLEAIRTHQSTLFDAEPPETLPGANVAQTRWLVNLEKTVYARWLYLRKEESSDPENETVYPLFTKPDEPPIRFVNDAGVYEPGTLAEAERAKLPPDAIAIVQQMLLWSPSDTRMLWLLGELYAAAGELRIAEDVFDQCTWGRSYSDRKQLMAHRAAINTAVAQLPSVETVSVKDQLALSKSDNAVSVEDDSNNDYLPSTRQVIVVGIGFVILLAGLVILQIRVIRLRRARHVKE